ncbi:MAG: ComEC/Rec2 family competence protein [Candidatus Limivicinus sp.]
MDKRKTVLLRSAAICIFLAVIFISVYKLKMSPAPENAEFIFAGTEYDADCTILLSGDECVLVDTGEAEDAAHIISLLREKNVETVSFIILTHPDRDHVGGASEILKNFSVEEIITPAYKGGGKEEYFELIGEAEERRIPVSAAAEEERIHCGSIEIEILPPERREYDKSNDYSLALTVCHGDVVMFMAGDAEKERLGELLKLELPERPELYKAAHHGRNSKKGVELIERLAPKNAVVTAAAPEKKIREAFDRTGTTVFTSVMNDIFFLSDGKTLELEDVRPLP